jgi:hypothetical protein
MRKLAAVVTLAAIAAVGPAQADKPTPPKPPKHPAKCVPKTEGFNASGTLIKAALTEAEGHGRYNGTLEVNVTKANHHAPTGDQTYTLTKTRVKFHHGLSATNLPEGSRVKLHGTITQLPNKHCPTAGFEPEINVKKVDIKPAKKK